ncbi:hypothetical protein Y1Q_0007165 [Alligator mississippiensis]|uniref:Uncharacterized protein n=1 Tax=Alligator mississippiensis TaxID=8496 RepID=A0A151N5S6_ALLMI|nr:hypothetical protein Y1Q_0007165 [Alligator mississippiensis]
MNFGAACFLSESETDFIEIADDRDGSSATDMLILHHLRNPLHQGYSPRASGFMLLLNSPQSERVRARSTGSQHLRCLTHAVFKTEDEDFKAGVAAPDTCRKVNREHKEGTVKVHDV